MSKRRIEIFHDYKAHPWLSKVYRKLGKGDLEICEKFIFAHDALGKGEFEFAINRMFLDQPIKPRRFPEILEILTCMNSAFCEASKNGIKVCPQERLLEMKQCSCGKTFSEIPKDARFHNSGDEFQGWYWECPCRSTLFIQSKIDRIFVCSYKKGKSSNFICDGLCLIEE